EADVRAAVERDRVVGAGRREERRAPRVDPRARGERAVAVLRGARSAQRDERAAAGEARERRRAAAADQARGTRRGGAERGAEPARAVAGDPVPPAGRRDTSGGAAGALERRGDQPRP